MSNLLPQMQMATFDLAPYMQKSANTYETREVNPAAGTTRSVTFSRTPAIRQGNGLTTQKTRTVHRLEYLGDDGLPRLAIVRLEVTFDSDITKERAADMFGYVSACTSSAQLDLSDETQDNNLRYFAKGLLPVS